MWLLGALAWLIAAPFWTDIGGELDYAFQYFTDRDALRTAQIDAGACFDAGRYDAAAAGVLGIAKEELPSPTPMEVANAAREHCEAENRIVRIGADGNELQKGDCAKAWVRAFDQEQTAEISRKKRQQDEDAANSKAQEQRCLVQYTPDAPRFKTMLWVLAIPTLGVALAALLVFLVFRTMRWVVAGFKSHP